MATDDGDVTDMAVLLPSQLSMWMSMSKSMLMIIVVQYLPYARRLQLWPTL